MTFSFLEFKIQQHLLLLSCYQHNFPSLNATIGLRTSPGLAKCHATKSRAHPTFLSSILASWGVARPYRCFGMTLTTFLPALGSSRTGSSSFPADISPLYRTPHWTCPDTATLVSFYHEHLAFPRRRFWYRFFRDRSSLFFPTS